jgi:DNA-binding transcriptional MerR regulator
LISSGAQEKILGNTEDFRFTISGLDSIEGSRPQMAHNEPIRRSTHTSTPSASDIPDKLYFRIGEVARLCEVPAYVLRFWESEFPQLKPNKGGTGQRLYRRRDVEMALRVKTLLKEEGYTIPGARAVLKSEFKQKEPQLALPGAVVPTSDARQLRNLRRELQSIATMLARPIDKLPGAPRLPTPPVHPIRTPRRTTSRIETPEIPFEPVE